MSTPDASAAFRLGIAEGVIARKWARVWAQRFAETQLEILPLGATGVEHSVLSEQVDAAIFRTPEVGVEQLHVIPLYEEQPVVVVPTDHYVCAAEEVKMSDLAGEMFVQPIDGIAWELPGELSTSAPETTREAIQIVAAGVGVLVLPMSLARLHHRKDLTYRPITDLEAVPVGCGWMKDSTDPRIEDLIGVLRGRTERSTRGGDVQPPQKRTAAQKAAARREYLAAQRPRQQGVTPKKGSRGKNTKRGGARRGRK